ncbi:right-handed parallel beta-helix repeat-containing protein [Streptacidiphilus pinicola]|uniref:right-handed parallel beta-helix repeat-containing protein n=1 Tax=Streptacidiphilus pinicola TaxID=2219663 RepID=UPI001A9EB570|nr:right-handed parallel beta-helix repeat-containing protein [Streptacidiphilus pinicola]
MTSQLPGRGSQRRPARITATATIALAAALAVPTAAHAAVSTTIYVSPTGSGTACSATAPCSLTQAKTSVEAVNGNMSGDIVVQLAGGTYRLTAPLSLGSADSGTNGHTVYWQAAPGQTPVISGGRQVTGWTLHDSTNNIYAASVPTGVDSRQLYVDGSLAPRAALTIARSDVAFTSTGMTIQNANLNWIANLPEQNRIELEAQNSFTDRFAPVQSISGSNVTMQEPAWQNNAWGYDTLEHPFAGGGLQLENSYSFLNTAGQWFLDPTAGELYYKAPSGWNPSAHDVELPKLTSLVDISGSYSNPVQNLAFQGISFEDTTWLAPSSDIGYADQQTGTFLNQTYSNEPSNFLSACNTGCQAFESTRNSWGEAPAAVQVSAASGISFSGDTFSDLGQVGLGIGQDSDAVASGTGLGASNITANGNTFTNDSGSGVVVGGVQPNAHHPSNSAMTDQNITISNNTVSGVAQDYKDMPGILSTYVTHAIITHNEVSNLAYDGIDIGWGWGINDPGGSQDYVNRGTYNYQQIYTTPTTLKNTVVTYNKVHGTKKVFHDGGSIYNLSADPGAVIDYNYVYDNNHTIGLYMDEGSRYVTLQNNVLQDNGTWAFTNASASNNTDNNSFVGNWYNSGGASVATGSPHNNVLSGNVQVSGTNWPAGAQQVISQAGVNYGTTTDDNTTAGTNHFAYSGSWGLATGVSDLYGGTAHYSLTANSTATFTFTGTQIAIQGVKDVDQGIVGFSIDGGPVTSVDDYSPTRLPQTTLWSTTGLALGTHTVTATVTGTKNSASSNDIVALDDAVASTIIDDATTSGTDSFAYGSNWGLATGVSDLYGGTAHYNLTAGSTATFTFAGTGATIHGVKDVDQGISTYSVDGGPAQSVDAYSSARLPGIPLFTVSGLPQGTHTITIGVTGTKNPASANDIVALDYATVP